MEQKSECDRKNNDGCTGPLQCENRKFDSSKEDCQSCLEDMEQALKEETMVDSQIKAKADIVIAMYSKNNAIVPQTTCIYVRDGEELRQVGHVQEVNLSVTQNTAALSMTLLIEIEGMSELTKKSLKEYRSLLEGKGCVVLQKG
jgi:hypothetical protein